MYPPSTSVSSSLTPSVGHGGFIHHPSSGVWMGIAALPMLWGYLMSDSIHRLHLVAVTCGGSALLEVRRDVTSRQGRSQRLV